MRKPIIAGNWKLNNTLKESIELVTSLKDNLSGISDIDIVVCPVFTSLSAVKEVIADSNIKLGAQDVFWQDSGAFTGEVSAVMLADVGVEYVIIGHSERRQYFGETNETVNRKIKAVLNHGLTPIVCLGEVLEEREEDKTFDVIKTQLNESFAGMSAEEMKKIVIAYEPVWAIGTGKTATPEQAEEVHKYIRELIANCYDQETASVVRIQYGGSVKPENISELIAQPDIDGALVGGASLKAESFIEIVKKSCVSS